ncbi:hypothetical protein QOT17_002983 [Balamuthia mandrillaris]
MAERGKKGRLRQKHWDTIQDATQVISRLGLHPPPSFPQPPALYHQVEPAQTRLFTEPLSSSQPTSGRESPSEVYLCQEPHLHEGDEEDSCGDASTSSSSGASSPVMTPRVQMETRVSRRARGDNPKAILKQSDHFKWKGLHVSKDLQLVASSKSKKRRNRGQIFQTYLQRRQEEERKRIREKLSVAALLNDNEEPPATQVFTSSAPATSEIVIACPTKRMRTSSSKSSKRTRTPCNS